MTSCNSKLTSLKGRGVLYSAFLFYFVFSPSAVRPVSANVPDGIKSEEKNIQAVAVPGGIKSVDENTQADVLPVEIEPAKKNIDPAGAPGGITPVEKDIQSVILPVEAKPVEKNIAPEIAAGGVKSEVSKATSVTAAGGIRSVDNDIDTVPAQDRGYMKLRTGNIKKTGFYGDAFDYSAMNNKKNGEFSLKIVNRANLGWGSAGIDFKVPVDITPYDRILVIARGRKGGERFMVNVRDEDWQIFDLCQSNSIVRPEEGLSREWGYVGFKLDEFIGDFDRSRLTHIGFEIGSNTVDNPRNCTVLIKGVIFCNRNSWEQMFCAKSKKEEQQEEKVLFDVSLLSSREMISGIFDKYLDSAWDRYKSRDYGRSYEIVEDLIENFENLSFKISEGSGKIDHDVTVKLASCYWLKIKTLIRLEKLEDARLLTRKLYSEYKDNLVLVAGGRKASLGALVERVLPDLELTLADILERDKGKSSYIEALKNVFNKDYKGSKVGVYASFGILTAALFGGIMLKKREFKISRREQETWLYKYKKPHWKSKRAKLPLKLIYELNTRSFLAKKRKDGKVSYRPLSSISIPELKDIRSQGFDAIWLMGIWEIGDRAKGISRNYGEDFEGSPYAIYEYNINPELGGEKHFMKLVRNVHNAGLKLIVDFVPNHMGIDSKWIDSNPEYFIHFPLKDEDMGLSEWDLLHKYPGFFPTESKNYPEHGKRVKKKLMMAYGKDPNFFPWIDTAQLDYTSPGLRIKMVNLLKDLARIVDGVRCDTVMLVLRDQIKNQWNCSLPWEYFDKMFPEEFWLEALREVRTVNPNFIFIAETYWDKEQYLQNLGINFTYNKTMYDLIARVVNGGDPVELYNYLKYCSYDFLSKSLYFLENHDEDRAINVFNVDAQKAASVIINALPGAALYHNGQLIGKKERLPVQRVIPVEQNDFDQDMLHFYGRGMEIYQKKSFRKGFIYILNPDNNNIICFLRYYKDEIALVAVNIRPNSQKCHMFLPADIIKTAGGRAYVFKDLYNRYLSESERRENNEPDKKIYKGQELVEKGIDIELDGFKSNVFLIKPV